MTGIVLCVWAPARQPRWVGRWSATPASHAALQAALSRRVSLRGRKRCKHTAENVVMRDVYTVLATMVAHDRINMYHFKTVNSLKLVDIYKVLGISNQCSQQGAPSHVIIFKPSPSLIYSHKCIRNMFGEKRIGRDNVPRSPSWLINLYYIDAIIKASSRELTLLI